jgi:hypothetical protein
MAEGGFFLCAGFNGFLGLGTDDGVGAPWVFQNNTHYYSADYNAGGWGTWEGAGFSFNGMIRAIGVAGAVESHVVGETGTGSGTLVYAPSTPFTPAAPQYSQAVNNGTRAFMGYNIYKNGNLLEALWPETSYTYNEPVNGEYCYYVTAEYEFCGESDPSNEDCVEITVGISDLDAENVRIYPNPSNNVVNIELNNSISHVVIYNYTGQVVLERNIINAETMRLNTDIYESGAYLVKFVTNNGATFTRRLVIAH